MTFKNNINIIFDGINKFTRKFYLFKLLSGILISLSLISIIYLSIILIHYFFYLSVTFKTFIFWSFLLLSSFIFIEFVFLNFLKIFSITKSLNNFQAAQKISDSFPDIKDQLLNILQLHNLESDSSLIIAAINRKIENIKIFSFPNAISFKSISIYLKYLIFPLFIFLFVFIYNKSILVEGNKKFIDYNVLYQPVAPFAFVLLNDSLTIETGADLNLTLQVDGNILPDQVFIKFGNNKLPLVRSSKSRNQFSYTFKSINNTFDFHFEAQGFSSKHYTVKVLPTPSILNYSIVAEPPAYTNKSDFHIINSGDILVPIGTKLTYNFITNNIDSLFIQLSSELVPSIINIDGFTSSFVAKSSSSYNILVKNSYFVNEIFTYNLTVIPDLFPKIHINSLKDSLINSKYYFKGYISDDYGFNNLSFNYAVVDADIDPISSDFSRLNINFIKSMLDQDFYFMYDFNDIITDPTKKLYYYFSVSDNDQFLGSKTTNTQIFTYNLPTRHQIDSTVNSLDNQVQDKLDLARQLAFDIQQDIENFNQRTLNEDLSEWEQQNFLNNLLQKQRSLNSMIDNLNKDNQDKIDELQQLSDQNEDLLDKQQHIQDLLENLMTDEMKAMLDSLQKMQQDFDKDDFQNMMQNSQQDYDELSDNLERSKQLLERMQIEQELQNTVDQLNKLADDLQKLSQNIDNRNDISSAQEDSILSNQFEFDKLMDDYDSLLKKNADLDKPMNLDSLNDQTDLIDQDFDDVKDQMFKDHQNKTSQNLQKTSQDMQEMSDQLSNMMSSNMQQSNSEDIQLIKFLLTNLISFSFQQENLNFLTTNNSSIFSNIFKDLKTSQLSLKDDFKIISDSLFALASRNPIVGTIITNEVNDINSKLLAVNNQLSDGNRSNASVNQRFIITSANKLALMLQESLEQMQNQMSMPGSGPPKPGNNPQPGIGDLKQLQDAMKQQLQQMMNQMSGGQMPGSQQLGTQLAQREAFQKMLQDMLNSGDLSSEMQQLVEEMLQLNDDIKNDVINRQITPQTIERDHDITTRLLDAQNADNQRKFDNQRQSNSSNNINHTVPDDVQSMFNSSFKQNDILSKKAINLNIYLKNYYNGYVHRLAD